MRLASVSGVPARDPLLPPADLGLLGPVVVPDNLTVTVGVGASCFDDRFGLELLIQFCADREETVIHALRDIIKNTPDLLTVRWKVDGFLPTDTIRRSGKETIRIIDVIGRVPLGLG